MKRTGSWAERQIPLASVSNSDKDMENNHEPEYVVKEEPPRELGMCRTLKIYFREYCANSSLHGIRYMGEKGRNTAERYMA